MAERTAAEWVTLNAMLQHPSWRGVEVLAGQVEEDRRVAGGVVVEGFGARLGDLHGKVLIVAFLADRTDWRLDAVLARARAGGAVAVLIAGHAPVRRSTALLSARLSLPLLGADDPLDAFVSLADMTGQAAAVRADLVERAAAACQRAGSAVEDVLTALEQSFRRSVALVDRSSNLVAGSAVLEGADAEQASALLRGRASNPPLGTALELASGILIVAHPLTGIGQGSWLIVLLPVELRAESDALLTALSVGTIAVQERLAMLRIGIERDARHRAALLDDVVRSNGEISPGARRRALDMGWRLDGWHVAMYFGAIDEVDTTDLRAEIAAALEREGVGAMVVERGKGWAAWTTLETEPTPEQIKTLGMAIRRAQRRLTTTVATYVGIGRVHPGPGGIAPSLAEAADAARLAQARPETGRFLHIDRLGLAQLLLAWTRTDTFQPAARELLKPLRNDSGDLLGTLSAYLDAESSTAETAAVLGIHRNTVTARVARIQDLLGVDLSDPETRLALHLACRTVDLPDGG